jgi:hypothetical protein
MGRENNFTRLTMFNDSMLDGGALKWWEWAGKIGKYWKILHKKEKFFRENILANYSLLMLYT